MNFIPIRVNFVFPPFLRATVLVSIGLNSNTFSCFPELFFHFVFLPVCLLINLGGWSKLGTSVRLIHDSSLC